jgi:hypothetical protein
MSLEYGLKVSKHRRAAKIDNNQPEIVKKLRMLPNITVEVGHDDILVGYKGINYWYEIKEPETVSNVTGQVRPSAIKDSQHKLIAEWKGHYKIVWNIDQILKDIGIN